MTYQNLWDTAKVVLSGKFKAMSAYSKRSERSQINDLILQPKKTRRSKTQNKQKERNNFKKG
jgi:hypothetical protein